MLFIAKDVKAQLSGTAYDPTKGTRLGRERRVCTSSQKEIRSRCHSSDNEQAHKDMLFAATVEIGLEP
jgi:hypothetical protein